MHQTLRNKSFCNLALVSNQCIIHNVSSVVWWLMKNLQQNNMNKADFDFKRTSNI